MLSGQDPLEWRVRKRWLLSGSAFPGSGPGPGLLCARSCGGRRRRLAGPLGPRCRLACPVSAFNLAARPEEGRGGARRPAARRAAGPGPGWGWVLGVPRGVGGGGGRGVTGVGSPAVAPGGQLGGEGAAGAARRNQPRLGSSGDSGGPGQGFPGFGEAAAGPIFRRSPECEVIVAATALAAISSSSWAAAASSSSSSSSSWAGLIPSPLPPPPGLGPRCLVPSRSRSCRCRRRRRLLIHPRAP
ncbi:elastin-like [Phyllostomus discolor]|uniref:Elastin-like n=1 Tax=Phyllostomus discolor TaxID=89673 RepID=A0A7E6E4A3_9CHIR|nr:elastin-like [Phyllostomus discolor]